MFLGKRNKHETFKYVRKHKLAYLTSFKFKSSYYKVSRRSPFEYASINKRSKSLGFMVSCARHCIREIGHTFYDG